MKQAKHITRRRRAGREITILAVAAILAGALALCTGASALADSARESSAHTRPDDVNPVSAADVRAQYHRRYPFAKAAADADVVIDGESQPGDYKYTAYKYVLWHCNDDPNNPNGTFQDIHYEQPTLTSSVSLATQRDKEAFTKGLITTFGLPISDTQFQMIDRENRQRFLELLFDPERWMWKETMGSHIRMSSMSNSIGGAAESSFRAAFDKINESLINVANENAATPASAGDSHRTWSQAIYVVQKMYQHVFVPMAILLLLPGALMTQIKGMVSGGFLSSKDDQSSPLEGILRAVIAIFLIPATQLIVSYAIDVGNALADTVRDPARHWVDEDKLFAWVKQQTYNPPQDNVKNGIFLGGEPAGGGRRGGNDAVANLLNSANPVAQLAGGSGNGQGNQRTRIDIGPIFGASDDNPAVNIANSFLNWLFGGLLGAAGDDGGQGKSAGQIEEGVLQENQLWLATTMQLGFNSSAYLFSYALTVLSGYQLVFMSYLFLLGPIAAAFFAWPSGVGSLFRKVFVNWLDAVVVLALWRFWWCAILAVMTQRIEYLKPEAGSATEMMVFNCFLVMLLYVPFQPFNFHPGPMVSKLLEKAGSGGGAGGGGAGAVTGGIPGGGQALVAGGGASAAGNSLSATAHSPGGESGDAGSVPAGSSGTGVSESGQDHSRGDAEGGLRAQDSGAAASPAGEAGTARRHGLKLTYPLPPQAARARSAASQVEHVSGGGAVNPAVAAVQASCPLPVQAVEPGQAPTVALGARGQGARVLLNTRNVASARAAVAAWQQMAPGAFPAAAGPSAGNATAGPPGSAGPSLSGNAASGGAPGSPPWSGVAGASSTGVQARTPNASRSVGNEPAAPAGDSALRRARRQIASDPSSVSMPAGTQRGAPTGKQPAGGDAAPPAAMPPVHKQGPSGAGEPDRDSPPKPSPS